VALAKMRIPSKINVGFQERKGTYTGRLAYVVYTDEKGVLRKERSWTSWRNTSIKPEEYENVPTSGFVLNKKVGDGGGGWDSRIAWIRVYDPRGFEFEITVQNLLFILEECTSTKGKGLEGEFVYAWDKADLVLLPASSQEYTSCMGFTEAKTKKVGKKDMVEGCVYKTKDLFDVMYMGRLEWFEFHHDYETKTKYIKSMGKKHVFRRMDLTPDPERLYLGLRDEFYPENGFTKLAEQLTDTASTDYPEAFDRFMAGPNAAAGKEAVVESFKQDLDKLDKEDSWNRYGALSAFIREHGQLVWVHVDRDYKNKNMFSVRKNNGFEITGSVVIVPSNGHYYGRDLPRITLLEVLQMDLFKLFIVSENGTKFEVK